MSRVPVPAARRTPPFRERFDGVVVVIVEVDDLIAVAVRPGSNSKQRTGSACIELLRADDTCRWRDLEQQVLIRACVVRHQILVGVADDHIAIQQQCRADWRIELLSTVGAARAGNDAGRGHRGARERRGGRGRGSRAIATIHGDTVGGDARNIGERHHAIRAGINDIKRINLGVVRQARRGVQRIRTTLDSSGDAKARGNLREAGLSVAAVQGDTIDRTSSVRDVQRGRLTIRGGDVGRAPWLREVVGCKRRSDGTAGCHHWNDAGRKGGGGDAVVGKHAQGTASQQACRLRNVIRVSASIRARHWMQSDDGGSLALGVGSGAALNRVGAVVEIADHQIACGDQTRRDRGDHQAVRVGSRSGWVDGGVVVRIDGRSNGGDRIQAAEDWRGGRATGLRVRRRAASVHGRAASVHRGAASVHRRARSVHGRASVHVEPPPSPAVVPVELLEHAAAVIESAARRSRECGVMMSLGVEGRRGPRRRFGGCSAATQTTSRI